MLSLLKIIGLIKNFKNTYSNFLRLKGEENDRRKFNAEFDIV